MANILHSTLAVTQDHGGYESWGLFFMLLIAVVICLKLIFTCASCKNDEGDADSLKNALIEEGNGSSEVSLEHEQDIERSNEERQGSKGCNEDRESTFLFDREQYNKHSDVETIQLTKKQDEHSSLTIFEEISQFTRLKKVTIDGIRLDEFSLSNLFQCTSIECLSLTNCSIESIPSSLTNLNNLKTLHLSNNNLTTMPIRPLHPMPSLTILNLSHNNIPAIGDAVKGLPALQTFDMSHNEMKEFPHEILYMESLEGFSCSHNKIARWLEQPTAGQQSKTSPLTYLDLSYNFLEDVPQCVKVLKNLRSLKVTHNKITVIGNVVMKLDTLQNFDVSFNDIEEIPYGILQMENLKTFHCNHNKITRWLEQSTAENQAIIAPLTYLDLSNNFLEDVPQCVKELENLRSLKVAHNKITVIGNVVMKLDTLQNLDVSFNEIDEIPYGILQMENLKELHCNHNKIARWPEPSDEGSKTKICHLEVLNLSNNSLEVVPGFVKELEDLLEVDLSCNNIGANVRDEALHGLAELFYLPSVSSLMFGNNNIKTLPQLDMAKVSTHIVKVDLRNNEIIEVPAALLLMPALRTLYLGGNKITNFPADLDLDKVSPALRLINLSNNELDDLPPVICLLPSLKKLDLKQNRINSISENVKSCNSLSYLDVCHNRLKEIPSYLFGLPKLKQILASNNQITSVSSPESPVVEVVGLAENGLSQFPEALIQMGKLKKADLRNNDIKVIPQSIMGMPKDVKLKLQDNPIIDPPLQVCQAGLPAIQAFHKDLTTASSITQRLKTLVLGTHEAGKTSLVRVIQHNRSRLTEPEERTHGIEITELALSAQSTPDITLSVWDFAGQEIYYMTHQFFLSAKALTLLIVNLEKYDSNSFSITCGNWMENMIAKVGNPVIIPVVTHIDKLSEAEVERRRADLAKRLKDQESRRISDLKKQLKRIQIDGSLQSTARKKQIEALLHKRPSIHEKPVSVSSSESLEGIEYLRQVILNYAVNKTLFPEVGRPIPKAWADTESCVERMGKDHSLPYMTWEEFESLVKKNVPNLQPASRIKTVAQYLHDTGKILWYSDIEALKNVVFVKPTMLVDIFRKVIQHDNQSDPSYREAEITLPDFETMQNDLVKRGVLHTKLLRCMWSNLEKKCSSETFDTIFNVLIELMRQFDLCNDLESGKIEGHPRDSKEHPVPSKLLIPWHIKEDLISDLEDKAKGLWELGEDPIISLQYWFPSFIPPGLFARLAVRAHNPKHDLHFVLHWTTGTLCKHKKNGILVFLRNESNERGEERLLISISARPESRTTQKPDGLWETLIALRVEIEDLLKQWPGARFDRFAVCPNCQKPSFPGEWLHQRTQSRRSREVICSMCDERVHLKLVSPSRRTLRRSLSSASEMFNSSTDLSDEPPLSDQQLMRVAEKLGAEWESLAIYMGFTKAQLDEFRDDHPYNARQQKFTMLAAWKDRLGRRATRSMLQRCLRKAEVDYAAIPSSDDEDVSSDEDVFLID